tara:strand:- start:537 stop:1199 length:663 start_codon:yes stop_codon:yes gene_type:complete
MAISEYNVGLASFPRDVAKDFPKVKPSLVLKGFGLQALKTKLYNFGEEEADTQRGVSYLGTPVFMNIEFNPGAYVDKKNNTIEYGQLFTNTADDSGFKIDTVLCDVTITKQIITTNIQGVNGSVKEYISQNDYEVTIRGALVDESGQRYPEEQVLQLVEYCEVPDSIQIFSRFLNDNFNIQYLTIQSVNLPQVEGTENVQLFEIKAISDDPIELTINEIN